MNPFRLFVATWVVGIVLCIISLRVGCGYINATVIYRLADGTLLPAKGAQPLSLGYTQQLNYGPWYALPIGAPLTFLLMALALHCSRSMTNEQFKPGCEIHSRLKRPLFAGIGLAIFCFFVCKNISVEVRDYGSLGLGWVQAESLLKDKAELDQGKQPWLTGKKFFVLANGSEFSAVSSAELPSISFARKTINHRSMLAFIVLAKAWVGFWEGAIAYFTVLTASWILGLVRHTKGKEISNLTGQELQWAISFVWYVTGVALMSNLFSVLRFAANLAKASYGQWDQYLSSFVLSPGLLVLSLLMGYAYKMSIENQINRLAEQWKAFLGMTLVVGVSSWLVWFPILSQVDPGTASVIKAVGTGLEPMKKITGIGGD